MGYTDTQGERSRVSVYLPYSLIFSHILPYSPIMSIINKSPLASWNPLSHKCPTSISQFHSHIHEIHGLLNYDNHSIDFHSNFMIILLNKIHGFVGAPSHLTSIKAPPRKVHPCEAPMEGQPQPGAPSSASWYATATVKIRKKIWQQAPDSGFMILDAKRGS